jgi:hypothetical protein
MRQLLFKTFLSCISFCIPFFVFADLQIVSLFPNTVDDTSLEYVDIRNTGCQDIDIWWYSFADENAVSWNGKPYIFPSPTPLKIHETLRIYPYDLAKIQLNNTNETLYIRDTSWIVIDTYHYSTSTKGVIINIEFTDTTCSDTSSSGSQSESWSSSSITGISPSSTGSTDTASWGTWWTGNTYTSETFTSSGWQVDASWISTGTGDTGNTSNSWSTNNSGTTFSWKLLAKSLWYLDTDMDSYIDTLFLDYGETLSWSINTQNIALYSNTGWLYENRINTETGYILRATLSWNSIFFKILSATQKKSFLKINNTTTSELRLKSSGNLWVTTLSGQELESFFLTTSFSEYTNIIHPNLDFAGSQSNSSAGSGNTLSWASNSWNTNSWWLWDFPQLELSFQNYTNTIFSWEVFTCSNSPCRVNFTLEPIFTWGFLEKDYICKIEYAGNIYETCNPPQLYPIPSFTGIVVQITRKSDAKIYSQQYWFIFESTKNTWWNQWVITDINPPIIIIDMDGKWREYYEQIGDYEYNCYTDTCSINLTAERSYDYEWWKVRFIWMYDMSNLSESKDPGERKFTLWDHDIWLRVIDETWNWSQVHYLIHVLGKKQKEEKTQEEKKRKEKKISTNQKLVSATKKNTKKRFKKRIASKVYFFDPPAIKIQDKNTRYSSWLLLCTTRKRFCSLNLELENTIKWVTYTWDYPDGKRYITKNPRSTLFPVGTSSITLSASYGTGVPFWSKTVFIRVLKETKTKKKTKNTVKKVTKNEKKEQENFDSKKEDSIHVWVFLSFFSGIWFLSIFPKIIQRRKKILNTLP